MVILYYTVLTGGFSLYGRAEFMIKDDRGSSCIYTQELGFGSSYTLIIPSTFTFGEMVTCKSTLSHIMVSVFVGSS